MTKTELIKAVKEKAGITEKDAKASVDAVIAVIEETLQKGENVQIPGFGTFEVRERPERESVVAFGEKKGTKVVTPAHKVPAFKAGTKLKEIVK